MTAAELADMKAMVENIGRTDYRSGLKSLSATFRYVKPIADARDARPLCNLINRLPLLLAKLSALMECEKALDSVQSWHMDCEVALDLEAFDADVSINREFPRGDVDAALAGVREMDKAVQS